MGGIWIEVLKDVKEVLVPATKEEIEYLLPQLKMYPILKGVRGDKGIPLDKFADLILKVSQLIEAIPEIVEMDLNPGIADENNLLIDVDNDEVKLSNDDIISLLHPVELSDKEYDKWKEHFEDYEITQPLEQINLVRYFMTGF